MKKTLLMGVSLVATAAAVYPAAAAGQWEGYYIGVSAGWGEDRARFEDFDGDWYDATVTFHPDGAVYGVQGGHNWQDRNFAWGIELDFAGTSIDRTDSYSSDVVVQNEVNWLATLRPRAGFALGDTFIYHTLGVAAGDFDRSWIELDDLVDDTWPDLGDMKWGVAGGFGVERAVGGNWSVRAEAQALRFFQDRSPLNLNGYAFDIDDTVFELKAGVNYAFGAQRSGGQYVQGQPYDFSGPFAGLSLGGHMATVQLTDLEYENYGSTYDLLSNSMTGGIQGGFNRQTNGLVYGVEGSFNFFGGDDATSQFGTDPFNTSALNWGGNVKFKAGAAADNTLMYLLAGYALADYDLLRESEGDFWDISGTQSGFVVGTGIEQALTPVLTGRVEATYSAFGGDTDSSPTNTDRFRGAAQDVAVTAGVNYYFGGPRTMGTGALAPANWAGFYAGVDGQFAYHHGTIWDRVYDDNGGTYDVPSFGAGAGVHVGHDWQSDTFVYGVLADFTVYTNEEDDTSPTYRSVSSSLNWMGSVRGRAGVATGEALFYATGGIAYADADLAYEYLPAPDPDSFIFDSSRFGWTAGLGIEKALSDRSSIKFETLYTSFGEETAYDGDTCTDEVTEPCAMEGYDDTITVNIGYSWRWNGLQ
ncbi:MAG: outer membrane beta-barrel protein [Alphaproteobacteria bacterium]|nr:outer membrane beta-barrel protein [Alphaproteobacteria bacterium]